MCKTAREFLRKYRKTHCCVICGESDYHCLEFHHLNPKDKRFSLSHRLRHDIDPKGVLKEMSKTCLLCANCHRKYHGGTLGIPDKLLYDKRVKVLISDYNQDL